MSHPPTIHYLEMTRVDDLRPGRPAAGLSVAWDDAPDPAFNRRCYEEVGGPWQWVDRLGWSDDAWRAHVTRDGLRTGRARVGGELAGYAELEIQAGGDVQIQYFGLLPDWNGQGLGGAFLSEVVREAWRWPTTRRVWVHTCTLDHPHALSNYRSRGFREYRTAAD